MFDRTVVVAEGSRAKDNACDGYTGADHSTFEGASALLGRIEDVRKARGEPCDLVVIHIGQDAGNRPVYGIREAATVGPDVRTNARAKGGPPQRNVSAAAAIALCTEVLASYPGMTLDMIMCGGRKREITHARRACIRAVYDAKLAPNVKSLSRFFHLDHHNIGRALEATDSKRIARYHANKVAS